jgi:hypothetical protein
MQKERVTSTYSVGGVPVAICKRAQHQGVNDARNVSMAMGSKIEYSTVRAGHH